MTIGSGQYFSGVSTPEGLDGSLAVGSGAHLVVELPGLTEQLAGWSSVRVPSILATTDFVMLLFGPTVEVPAGWELCSGQYFDADQPWGDSNRWRPRAWWK